MKKRIHTSLGLVVVLVFFCQMAASALTPKHPSQQACDFQLSSSFTNVSCIGGADGAINLSVLGGTSPYTYDWSNDGAEDPDNDPQDISGLTAGSYSVTVTDATDCSSVLVVNVGSPPSIVITGTVGNVTILGSNDGYVDIFVTGGTSPYTYDWSNDGPDTPDNDTEDLYDLPADTYSITVTDANGCSSAKTFTVNNPLVFDLALRKTLGINQSATVLPGDLVTFSVTIFNQGQLAASNILVFDYVPNGMTFSANQNSGWTNFGAGPTWFIPNLAPGATLTRTIKLKVNANVANGTQLNNYVEISAATSSDPNATDIDSEPNAFLLDDPGGLPGSPADDVLTGNGTGQPGSNDPATDEDDHDGAAVEVNQPSVSIGNLVFFDVENDGIFNNNDFGIGGVEVELHDAGADHIKGTIDDEIIDNQLTNANGEYLFTGLPNGFYYITLNGNGLPANLFSSTGDGPYDMDGAGSYEPAPSADNNQDQVDDGTQSGVFISSDVVELSLGNEPNGNINRTVDFAIYEPQPLPTLSVGNLVFNDFENDGVFNNNDAGMEGVEVELRNLGPDQTKGTADDETIDNQFTDNLGGYLFTGLAEGTFYIFLNGNGIPANHVSSTGDGPFDMDGAGSFEPADSTDYNYDNTDDGTQMGASIMSDTIHLSLGDEPDDFANYTVDFGLYEPQVQATLSIGNLVFQDANNDGIFNNNDNGIAEVEVLLYDAGPDNTKGTSDDVLLDNQFTNGLGLYLFTGLVEGLYFVKLSGTGIPANYVSSTGDGIYDMDGSGSYEPAQPANNNQDNVDDGTQAGNAIESGVVELSFGGEPDGDVNTTLDFGLYAPQQLPASMGNFVWYDMDHNGQQGPNEPGVPELIVNLVDAGPDGAIGGNDDQLADSQTTSAGGIFFFQNIVPGDYYLMFDLAALPTNYHPTLQNLGDDNTDNDVDALGRSHVFTLAPNETNVSIDFGIEPAPSSLGNFVWQDYDGDARQDFGEPGVSGISVYLYDLGNDGMKSSDDHQIATQETNADGFFNFDNLNPGSYYLVFNLANFAAGFQAVAPNQGNDEDVDSDANALGATEVYHVEAGTTNISIDFGVFSNRFDLALVKSLSPGQSTTVDIGQPINYTIQVTNQGHNPAYNVEVVDHIPSGLFFGQNNTGWNLLDPSTAAYNIAGPLLTGQSVSIQISLLAQYGASGASMQNRAEIVAVENINGDPATDFDSTPDNSLPSEDDMGEAGITLIPHDPTGWIYCDKTGQIITGGTISVTGPNGIPNSQVFIINNGSSGYYEFYTNGTPGVYTLSYTHPAGYPLSTSCNDLAGPFDPSAFPNPIVLGVDTVNAQYLSNVNCASNPYYLSFDIEPGDPNIHLNNLPVACTFISSFVKNDSNFNDANDASDAPIVGATVSLYDCADLTTPIATTMTDATGRYRFDGMVQGDYVVGFAPTAGYRFISTGNINAAGFSACTSLAWGECDTTLAFVRYQCPTIDAGPDIDHCSVVNATQLDANLSHGTGVFTWTPPTGLSDPSIENPVASPPKTTDFVVSFNDGFGCVATDTITVTVGSTTPYMTNTPFANQTVQCAPLPSEAPIFADDCDASLTIVADTTTTNLPCGFIREITWTATNDEGNATSFVQILTVNDTQAPTMNASHPLFGAILDGDTLFADCSMIPSLDSLGFAAFDNCSATTITFTETVTDGNCPVDGFYQNRHCGWTATDVCGNVDSLFFTVIIYDNLPPVLSPAPANVSVSCSAIPAAATLTATDNCTANPTIVLTEVPTINANGCTTQIVRTWTVTDDCGNFATASQTLAVSDTQIPTIVGAPANIILSCSAPLPAVPVVTATDACDNDVPVTYNQIVLTGDPASGCYRLARVWRATDNCGNLATATQFIQVTDTTPPTLSGVPADMSLSCSTAIPAAPAITATDACDASVTVTMTPSYIGDPTTGCFTLVRTWTATDDCGNTATASQNIVVSDNAGPVFSGVPANLILNCGAAIPAPPIVTAFDNCDAIGTVNYLQSTNGNPATGCYVITRTWSATDDCGNLSSASQTITVQDNVPPTLSAQPANLALTCVGTIPTAPVITASDNCDSNVPVLFFETSVGDPTGCNYQLTRTWAASDDCGNTVAWSQTITVNDNVPPVLVGTIPANIAINCGTPLPAPPNITATDNCDASVTVTMTPSYIGDPNGGCYLLTRTWTATDDCGNAVSASQDILVRDTKAPNFVGLPVNAVVSCDNIPGNSVTATDNCDASVTVTMTPSYIGDPNGGCYLLTRTWTATDDCGNAVSASQDILVRDTEAPNFVGLPVNVVVSCDNIPGNSVTATDNCDASVSITVSDQIQSSVFGCVTQVVRTWTATDDCGNTRVASRTFNVTNTDAPVLSIATPAFASLQDGDTVRLECDQLVGLNANSAVATADCCGNPTITFHETVIGGNCPTDGYLAVMHCGWVATDCCGNSDSLFITVIMEDNTPPSFLGIPASAVLPLGSPLPPAPTVFTTDNCDGSVPISYNSVTTGPASALLTTRTWSASDDCGNIAIAVQTILITNDIIAPILANVPADETIEGPVAGLPNNYGVTATDDLDPDPEISFREERSPGTCCYVITRTWTATDDFGNSSSATQTINVVDTQAPVISGTVADVTGTCGLGAVPMPQLAATDNCTANLNTSFQADTVQTACGFQVLRQWTFSDECGNAAIATQTINVEDTEAPSFDASAAPSVVYYASQNATANGGASLQVGDEISPNQNWSIGNQPMPSLAGLASDNCASPQNLVFKVDNIVAVSIGCEQVWTVAFQVLDACGNAAVEPFTASATFVDDTAPIFTNLPQNLTVGCGSVPAPATLIATDASGSAVSIDFMETIGTNCPLTILRTWTATDACGNSAIAEQSITVLDNAVPNIENVPASLMATCGSIPAVPTNIVATDACNGQVPVIFNETISSLPGTNSDCSYTIVRTWTAADPCGNSVAKQQFIWVADNTPPSIASSLPTEVTVNCEAALPPVPALAVSDNCDDSPTVEFTETVQPGSACSYALLRKWTVTDNCGNSAIAEQTIRVVDNTLPSLANIPNSITVGCGNIPAAPAITAGDNCDVDVVVIFKETYVTGCPAKIKRTWKAVDDCGNEAEATQIITVLDNQPPVLSAVPTDLSLACGSAIPAAAVLTASDDCGSATPVILQETETGNGCDRQIRRTWTATDACGNASSVSQTITVTDTEAPVFAWIPMDYELDCGEQLPTALTPLASDNCDANVQVDFVETATTTTCVHEIKRTWTATDDCGNSNSVSQVFRFTDHEAPTVIEPQDLTVDCEGLPDAIAPAFSDDCDRNLDIVFSQISTPVACGQNLLRTWTATDQCGNSTTVDQLILVTDLTGPAMAFANPQLAGLADGDTLVLGCDNDLIFDETDVAATDRCGSATKQLEFGDVVYGTCDVDGFLLLAKFNWTATDECGNATTLTLNVKMVDDTAPVFAPMPATVIVNCGEAAPDFVAPEIESDCSEVTLGFASQTVGTAYGQDIVGTWTATDACGNTATTTQTMQVYSVGAAQLLGVPTDLSVNLATGETVPSAASVSAIDNCSGDALTIVFTENIQQNDPCNAVIQRSWSAVGLNGATVSATQTITVADGVQFAATMTADSCNSANGSVQLTPSAFDFVWSDGGAGAVRNDLAAGTYTVTATNTNGCTSIQQIEVAAACNCQAATVKEVRKNISKCGEDKGKAVIHLLQSAAGYSFEWTPNLGTPSQDGRTRTNLPPGHYEVNIVYNNLAACATSVEFDIVDDCPDCGPIFSDLESSLTGPTGPTELCLPVPFALAADYDIEVDGAAYMGMVEPCDPHSVKAYNYAAVPTVGPYTVAWQHDGIVLNTYVAQMADLSAAMNFVDPLGNWFNDAAAKQLVSQHVAGDYGLLSIRKVSNGASANLMATTSTTNTGTMLTLPAGGHVVTYTSPATGCSDEISVSVQAEEMEKLLRKLDKDETVGQPGIKVFESFSPNGDGLNDYLRIEGLEAFPNHELKVYNVLGQLVFRTGHYESNWGGSWGQNNLSGGTYFYLLEDGKGNFFAGHIQILR